VVEDLPGVARTSPIGGGLLVIRGSKPGDSLVFLDGQPVPLIYHFGALSSTVNPDLLEAIDLLPGNFSVYYGDMTGGLIEVRSRKLRDELHGYANLGLIDTSLMLEGPTGVEGLTFAVAGRRSYFDLILKQVFSSADVGLSVAPVYYDGQFRLDYRPKGSNHSFSLFALTSKDELALLFNRPLAADPNVSGNFDLVTAFSQIRGRHQWHSGQWSVDTNAMFEWVDGKIDVGQQYFTLALYDSFLRSTITRDVDESLQIAGGVDIANRRARVAAKVNQAFLIREGEFNQNAPPRPDDKQIVLSSQPFNRFSPGVWVEGRVRPLPKLLLNPGLRFDLFQYSPGATQSTVSPRVTGRYEWNEQLALKAGFGRYTEGARNGDAARPFGNPDILPEIAWQTTAGFEARPVPGIFLSFEGYYKWLDQVISRSDALVPDGTGQLVPQVLANTGIGRIYGVEVLLRRELSERFFGWIAYSLSRSVRRDTPDSAYRLFDFDQTHALTVIASYKLPAGWQMGGRFRLISGNPETPIVGATYLASADVYLPIFGATNSSRLPLFHQLDFRVDKVWTYDQWSLDLYLDVVNAYNHRSIEGTTYSYDYTQKGVFQGLPVLPTLGMKGSF
jgi:outer membrane receptor protein involved in Fe transport